MALLLEHKDVSAGIFQESSLKAYSNQHYYNSK